MWLRLLSLQEFVWCSRPQGRRRLNPALASNALLHAICIFSYTARGFFSCCGPVVAFFESTAQPHLSSASGSGLDFNCLQSGTTHLCSHKGFFGGEQGKVGWWLGGSQRAAFVKQELYWTRTRARLYRGWCLNLPLPCAVWLQSSSFISFPVLMHCAIPLHSFSFGLIQNHTCFNSWAIISFDCPPQKCISEMRW